MGKLIKKSLPKGLKKKKTARLSELQDHKQNVVTLSSRVITLQKKRISPLYKPEIKRLGMKDIVITPLKEITPIVVDASPDHVRNISPRQVRFAKMLKRMPFADIRRIGADILGE